MPFWTRWLERSPRAPINRHGKLPPVRGNGLLPADVPHWRDTQRPFTLPTDLAPDTCADLAARVVRTVADVLDGDLDYSLDSLETVDRLLESFMPMGSDVWIESIVMAGCYVGEVVVRHHPHLAWGRHDLFGPIPVLVSERGDVVNPIGKAIKRVELGSGENIPYFVEVMTRPRGSSG